MALWWQCNKRQEDSKWKQRWTERADSIYEAYKGDSCHCFCHLVLPCLTDKRMMKCFIEYPPDIFALNQICEITILGIAGVKTLDLDLRFELDWSKNLQNVYCLLKGPQQHHCIGLLLLCCPTLWRQLNLGNFRRYSFTGFFGLKYWPEIQFPVPPALESSSNSPLPTTAACLSILPGNRPFSFHLFGTGNSLLLSPAAASFL